MGSIASIIGPLFPVSKTADKNLSTVLKMPKKERRKTIKDMWRDFGMTSAEYCHIENIDIERDVVLNGAEMIHDLIQSRKPAIIVGAHLSNFQMISAVTKHFGLTLLQLYRRANNPRVDEIMKKMQEKTVDLAITKGANGTKKLINALQNGKCIYILVDQKLNEGEMIPFIGHDAMTTISIAKLCKKFDCPIIPARVERINRGVRFEVTFYKPINLSGSEIEIMRRVNDLISEWVLARPEQWMWLHRRWPFC